MKAQYSKWPTGLGFQQRKTAKQIADWVREHGYTYGPITDSKSVPCKHGVYSWNDCEQCSLIQIADAIEDGEWFNAQ